MQQREDDVVDLAFVVHDRRQSPATHSLDNEHDHARTTSADGPG
jgi:hypothetical protein